MSLASSTARKSSVCRDDFTYTKDTKRLLALSLLGNSIKKTKTLIFRLFKLLGVEKLALTNAAGGLNQNFKLGDFMLVKDHLNLPALLGLSPTLGVNDLYWGPRFINMHNCYDSELRDLAKKGENNSRRNYGHI